MSFLDQATLLYVLFRSSNIRKACACRKTTITVILEILRLLRFDQRTRDIRFRLRFSYSQ